MIFKDVPRGNYMGTLCRHGGVSGRFKVVRKRLIDYACYNLTIFRRYSFKQKLSFAQLFLNNYPTKIKEVHVINNPKLVGITYSLIRPFLPEKLRKRVSIYLTNCLIKYCQLINLYMSLFRYFSTVTTQTIYLTTFQPICYQNS